MARCRRKRRSSRVRAPLWARRHPEFEIEAGRRTVAVERLRIIEPIVVRPLDRALLVALPRLPFAAGREAQGKGPAAGGRAFAQLDAADPVPPDLPIVAAKPGRRLAHGEEDLADDRCLHLTPDLEAVSLAAGAAHMHLVDPADPQAGAVLLDAPARPPFAAGPLAGEPNLGRGGCRAGQKSEGCEK